MELAPRFIDRLDLSSAVAKAAPAKGEFFPSRLESQAALLDVDGFADWLEAQLATGLRVAEPEVVWVPRSSPGFRPVPYLSFEDRVIYEGIVNLVAHSLGDDINRLSLRSLSEEDPDERSDFERRPLDESNAPFVAIADIASCYEYVDHQKLAQEIVELTGDIDSADVLAAYLSEVMVRGFGVPQGPRPSDVLADIYLSAVDLELERAGIELWRGNDDYRLAATNSQDALRVIRQLESALRDRGMVLNHQKSRIVDRDTYQEWVEALATAIEDAKINTEETSFYSFDPESFAEAELDDLNLDAIESLFLGAIQETEQGPYLEGDRLLQQTLPLLAAGESLVPLQHLGGLTSRWPIHARHVSLYLRELMHVDPENVSRAVGKALNSRTARTTPWVKGWLLDPLARSSDALKPKNLAVACRQWLKSEQEPWFVRGRSAIVLAQREIILDQESFNEIYSRAPTPAKADLVAAVRLAEPKWGARWLNAAARDPLLRRIADWDEPDWLAIL